MRISAFGAATIGMSQPMSEALDEPESESPDGAAVFPLIPPELGVHPLLMAALHAYEAARGRKA